MKANILNHTIAALLLAVPFAKADDQNKKEEKDNAKLDKTNASTSVTTSADGTATVTIDINGAKETRTFKLSDGKNGFSLGVAGEGGKGFIGMGGQKFGAMKKEKGPWVGIAMEPVQEVVRAQLSLAPGEGVVVAHVAPDSPAAKAGLTANDILLRFEDQILVEPSQLQKLIAMKKPGDSVKLGYLRKGERKDATVTLIEHELEAGGNDPTRWFQNTPGIFSYPGAGGDKVRGAIEERLKQMKEKHPGIVVDKRSWMSGVPADGIKGQLEKVVRALEDSKLPKEEVEKLRKELEKAQGHAEEAMEKAKRSSAEAMEQARRAMEEASKALHDEGKPHGKDKSKQPKEKTEQLKQSGEPL